MSKASATKRPATQFHIDLFDAANAGKSAVTIANNTLAERTRGLLQQRYADTCPTYDEFRADRAALAVLAEARGLKSDQCARKAYNAAVKALYGALPVSDAPAAVLKRLVALNKSAAPSATKGPAKGETGVRNGSAADKIQQMIASVGVLAVLKELTRILAEENATKDAARKCKAAQESFTAAELRKAA